MADYCLHELPGIGLIALPVHHQRELDEVGHIHELRFGTNEPTKASHEL